VFVEIVYVVGVAEVDPPLFLVLPDSTNVLLIIKYAPVFEFVVESAVV
jgi:hypothetical protein